MKEINFSKELELKGYYERLENGLEVYLVPMEKKDKYFITYATKFGSIATQFTPYKEKSERTVPNGVAHFLEHKMFEQEDGIDPFTFFSESGTDANASTNFDLTRYICYGTKNFDKNLRYLIKYVNSPYFTDENVEKEKGIIAQEINMYKDEAGYAIEDTLRKNTYHSDNHRVDIAGEVRDIEKITKEDLYLCYDNFYQPQNMFLLVVGKFDVENVKSVVDEVLRPLKNKTGELPKIKQEKEKKPVKRESEVVPFNISIPKFMMSLKCDWVRFDTKDEVKLDLYLNIILDLVFGNSSTFKERVTNNNLLTKFYFDVETIKNYKTIYLYAESTHPSELIEEIKKEFGSIEISLEDLERYKKVLIASTIKCADYVDAVTVGFTDDISKYGKIIGNPIEICKSLDIKELNTVLKGIDFKNRAVVTYVPKNMPNLVKEEVNE